MGTQGKRGGGWGLPTHAPPKVDTLEGACDHCLACSTCQVIVTEPWKAKLRPPTEEELDMLELAHEPTPDSRLACQVLIKAELAGLTVTVPSGVINRLQDQGTVCTGNGWVLTLLRRLLSVATSHQPWPAWYRDEQSRQAVLSLNEATVLLRPLLNASHLPLPLWRVQQPHHQQCAHHLGQLVVEHHHGDGQVEVVGTAPIVSVHESLI